MVFALKAHASGSRITRAVVSYRYTGEPTTGDVSATFSPGTSVTTQARLNTRTHYMPPGVAISYYWSIDDDAGHHFDTAPQVIRYEDKRYAWQVAEDKAHNLRVHWYQGGASFGQALRKTAVAGLDRLQANFGSDADPAGRGLGLSRRCEFHFGAAAQSAGVGGWQGVCAERRGGGLDRSVL